MTVPPTFRCTGPGAAGSVCFNGNVAGGCSRPVSFVVRHKAMSTRFPALMLRTFVVPVASLCVGVLGYHWCSRGGLWYVLPFVWFLNFFVLGFGAHGFFYLFALPTIDYPVGKVALVRVIQTFWFLQVPLAMMNGIRPPLSIVATQGVALATAIGFVLVSLPGQPNRVAPADGGSPHQSTRSPAARRR
jgi:hypothetical protein